MSIEVSAQKLVEAGSHFGHLLRRTNPKMKQFQYGVRDGNFIFDLLKTKEKLEEALAFIEEESKKGKTFLIVGTKKQIQDEITAFANETKSFFVRERWLGGTFTNFDQIKRTLTRSLETKKKMEAGEFSSYTKKERLMMSWDIEKTERMMGGLNGMDKIPSVMIVVDTKKEFAAVREASLVKVPVVGLVDSNGDPDLVDYPIPVNDDASSSVSYVLGLIKEAILKGRGQSVSKNAASQKEDVKVKPEAKTKQEVKVKKEAKTNATKKKTKTKTEKVK